MYMPSCLKRLAACALLSLIIIAIPARAQQIMLPLPTSPGDSGRQVRLLQEELARRGYFAYQPDSQYHDLTIKAVECFQRDRKLPVSGVADAYTLQALFPMAHADTPPAASNNQAGFPQQAAGFPLPSRPGQRGPHVMALQAALANFGYYEKAASGVYDACTTRAVQAFQQDRGLVATGQADKAVIRLLYTMPSETPGETLMPHWYAGGSGCIPWGAAFELQDVWTGNRFTCVRIHGYSHLDAEPLTYYDTITMRQVYQGKWSWARRPVLLKYRGNVYAASMNGKPHGIDAVPRNGMEGHFCIHFFGSLIDGSQRIDEKHLLCATEASYARWE
jgi:peptidoglycan hydrolase-like protein with peptidoglycan-binding domain